MACTITHIYLQVKNLQLKKPAEFMMLVLKDFPISSPGRFGISAYYMALFYWHYPFHLFSLLSASFQICTGDLGHRILLADGVILAFIDENQIIAS